MIDRMYLEAKLSSAGYFILVNVILAVIIYLSAEFGKLMGVQSPALNISVVWPASGISLAALLIFGINVLPGIFIGNFFYNFIQLYSFPTHISVIFAVSLAVSIGSLIQAWVGGAFLRRYSSETYFKTAMDVVLFLFFGGILTCMIASTIGVSSLYFTSIIPWDSIYELWITFWLGDLFGIYIFTPLAVVWLLQSPTVKGTDHPFDLLGMISAFLIISIFFYENYPVTHFYIPLSVWCAYRFLMHGATLGIFLVSFVSIFMTSLGIGLVSNNFEDPLPILVSLLAIIVSTSLILAAIVHERAMAMYLLKDQNIDLQETIDKRLEKIQEMHQEMIIKDKLASLGMMTLSIAGKMQDPLTAITDRRSQVDQSLHLTDKLLSEFPGGIEAPRVLMLIEENDKIRKALSTISEHEKKLSRILDHVRELSSHTESKKMVVKLINLKILINQCLDTITKTAAIKHPNIKLKVKKTFTRTIPMIPALPEELGSVFVELLEESVNVMALKRKRLGDDYKPVLFVHLIDEGEMIELGIETETDENMFSGTQTQEEIDLEKEMHDRISLAKDIISFLHQGELDVQFLSASYFKAKVMLPRTL